MERHMLMIVLQLCWLCMGCLGVNNHAKVGFHTLMTEFTNASVTRVSGEFPKWIKGRFIRQVGGSFGNLDSHNPMERIEHWFDGVGGAGMYHITDGEVKFTNKFYDTRGYNIWKSFDNDWARSQVSWVTIFSPYNYTRMIENLRLFPDKRDSNPSVNFWKLEEEILAVTENHQPMLLNKDTMESRGLYPYKDRPHFGLPEGTILVNQPAHDRIDMVTGEQWMITGAIVPLTPAGRRGLLTSKLILYQVINETRIPKGEIVMGNISLGECNGAPYPDTTKLMPYLHSFTMTKNYIIIPGTSMMLDYCDAFIYSAPGDPTFKRLWKFRSEIKSKVYVVRKSNMEVAAAMEIDPMFVTH
ncbi:unnamed protein product [Owenia fusiformis]|uniref:Uncharacterized protein n=1 Tax=Owenia fusiformis TaxID=6347 RepID=A0A8J1UCR7_OWEFU|nr:unnamed protein product [Owenia fusiformis]